MIYSNYENIIYLNDEIKTSDLNKKNSKIKVLKEYYQNIFLVLLVIILFFLFLAINK